MSCIGKFQSFEGAPKVSSASYYNLTSIAGTIAGTSLYESSLSSQFKNHIGFDWTTFKPAGHRALNRLGEPKTNAILNYHNIPVSPRVKHGIEAIDSLFEEGYMGKSFTVEYPLRVKLNEMSLNPRFTYVDAKIFNTGEVFYLQAKATATPQRKQVDQDFLERTQFLPELRNIVDKYGESDLNALINELLGGELQEFERQMLTRFRDLSSKNPTLKLVIFDSAEERIERSFYHPKSNTIFISKDLHTRQSRAKLIADVIHEAAHSYTISAIVNPQTPEEVKFRDSMQAVYDDIKDLFTEPAIPYGMTNLEEFVSEYMSNPTFRSSIQQLDDTLKKPQGWMGTILQALRTLFRNIFNLPVVNYGTKLDNAIEEYLNYLDSLEDMPLTVQEEEIRFAPPTPAETTARKVFNQTTRAALRKGQSSKISTALRGTEFFLRSLNEKFTSFVEADSAVDIFANGMVYFKQLSKIFNEKHNGQSMLELFVKNVTNSRIDEDQQIFELENFLAQLDIYQTQLDDFINYAKTLKNKVEYQNITPEFRNLFEVILDQIEQAIGEQIPNRQYSKNVENFISYIEQFRIDINSTIQKVTEKANEARTPLLLKKLSSKISQRHIENFKKALEQEIAEINAQIASYEAENNPAFDDIIQKKSEYLTTRKTLLENLKDPKDLLAFIQDWKRMDATFSPGVMSNIPIVQMLANFIDQYEMDATTEVLKQTNRLTSIHNKLKEYRKKTNFWTAFKGQKFTEAYYSGINRRVEVFYLNERTGEIRKVIQMGLNTKQDYVAFHNDYITAKSNRIKAELNFLQVKETHNKLDANGQTDAVYEQAENEYLNAKKAEEKFLEDNAERPYTDNYYAAEEILDRHRLGEKAREKMSLIIAELNNLMEFKQLQLPEVEEERKQKEQELKELRNPFKLDGTLKSPDDVEIAKLLNQYYAARRDAGLVTAEITPEDMMLFETTRKEYLDRIQIAEAQYLAETDPDLKDILEQELRVLQDEFDEWREQNTRREIDPDFWAIEITPILTQIENIYANYNQDPQISQMWEEIMQISSPKRDADGIIVGTGFTTQEAARIKEREEKIKQLREALAQVTTISDQDKLRLKSLFDELTTKRRRKNTVYYYRESSKKIAEIEGRIAQAEHASIMTLAEEVYEALALITNGQQVPTDHPARKNYFFMNNLGVADIISNNPTLERNQAIADIYKAILGHKASQARMQDPWFTANHTVSSKTYFNPNFFGDNVTYVRHEFKPIYIWQEYVPTNPRYIKTEQPSSKWYTYKTEANPNFEYGNPKPRQGKYMNAGYAGLAPELQQLVDEYADLLTELNNNLPPGNRVKNFLLPTSPKTAGERANSIMAGQIKEAKSGIFNALKSIFFERDDESEFYHVPNRKNKQNRLTIGIRHKYIHEMNAAEQSHDVTDLIHKFAVHSITSKYLMQAAPTAYGAYNIVKDSKNLTNSVRGDAQQTKILEEMERTVYRSFFGSSSSLLRDSGTWTGIQRFFTTFLSKLLNLTKKALLALNFVIRSIKNFFQAVSKSLINNSRFNITAKEYRRGLFMAFRQFNTHMSLSLGSDTISKETALFLELNLIPTADLSNFSTKGTKTFKKRYMSLHTVASVTIGGSEFIPAAAYGNILMERSTVKFTDASGNTEFIPIKDAYDYTEADGLVPKQGVDLESLEQAKLYIRNESFHYNYNTTGQYYKRSKAYWKENVLLKLFLFLKAEWLIPGLQNYFGGRRDRLIFGQINEGIYRTPANAIISMQDRQAYFKAGLYKKAFKPNLGNVSVKTLFSPAILTDTMLSVGFRLLSVLHLTFILPFLVGGGDDEKDKPWYKSMFSYLNLLFNVILNGVDDEVSSITNPLLMGADIKAKLKYTPWAVKDEGVYAGLKAIAYSMMDNTTRAIENVITMGLNPEAITDPLGNYIEYSESGLIPKATQKKVFEGRSNLFVAIGTLMGVGALEPMVDPSKRIRMGLIYTPRFRFFVGTPYTEKIDLQNTKNRALYKISDISRKAGVMTEDGFHLDKSKFDEIRAKLKPHVIDYYVSSGLLNKLYIDNPQIAKEEIWRQASAGIKTAMLQEIASDVEGKSEFAKLKKGYKKELRIKEIEKEYKKLMDYEFITEEEEQELIKEYFPNQGALLKEDID